MLSEFLLYILLGLTATSQPMDSDEWVTDMDSEVEMDFMMMEDETAMMPYLLEVEQINQTSTIPPGASRIHAATVRITPSCNDVFPTALEVQRRGLGAKEDIKAIYLSKNGVRMSPAKAITKSDNSVSLSLRDFDFSGCDPIKAQLLVDFAANASPTAVHRFEVQGLEGVKYELSTSSTSAASVSAIDRVGSISIEHLNLTSAVRFGNNRTLARITLENTGDSDQVLEQITFINNGSAKEDDITNIRLKERNGTTVTLTTPQLDHDGVTVVFEDGYVLEDGVKRLFELVGTVNVGSSETIGFTIETASDIVSRTMRR